MAQLIVRNLEEEVVKALKMRAARKGRSAEEEHREIRRGIENIRRRDPHAAASLDGWLQRLQTEHTDRILPVDLAAAEE